MIAKRFLLFFILFICSAPRRRLFARGDIFAALTQLRDLISLEEQLGESLDIYIEAERARLEKIKTFSKIVKDASQKVKLAGGGEHLINNPGNSYGVIKRFVSGWSKLQNLLEQDYTADLRNQIILNEARFPNYKEDLIGAVAALIRLQDTYNLTARELVEGRMKGCSETAVSMAAEDCFEISTLAYNAGRLGHFYSWVNEALRLLRDGHHDGTLKMVEVLEHAAWAEYLKGNADLALNRTLELLELEPDHSRALENVIMYKKERENGLTDTPSHASMKEDEEISKNFTNEVYASLCRGEVPKKRQRDKLSCWYHGTKIPALMLKPIKVEMVLRSPAIYLFREIISDKEAEDLKELARPKLARATVFNPKTSKLESAEYRVSKSAWLKDDHHVLIKHLNKRFETVTGLNISTAEALQIGNYGIAGQYDEHIDFGKPGSPLDKSANGNRIATLLVYLNDVEAGGFTVFVKKGVFLEPKKGDAAFWFNLRKSGKGLYDTKHAACPVLCGNKWVANKWFHERGQEFRRPCALTPNI